MECRSEGLGGSLHFLGDQPFMDDRRLGGEGVGHRAQLLDEGEAQGRVDDVLLQAAVGGIRPGHLTFDDRHGRVTDAHLVINSSPPWLGGVVNAYKSAIAERH